MKRFGFISSSFLWVVGSASMLSSSAAETAPEKDLEVKGSIQQLKALLVSEIGKGEMAGFAQNLTITSVKTGGTDPLSLQFNQDVGDDMRTALDSVVRGLQVSYGAWPHGYSAQLSFENKYSPKDGPSAAVACALLLDGLIQDAKYDSNFAVTGDLNSDLSVQPVGGVESKIGGATKRKCEIIGIPVGNRLAVEDMAAMGDYKTLAGIQVFTIDTLDQARDLALAERPANVQQSIDDFARLQKAGLARMNSKESQAILRAIIQRTPHHLSAEMILRAALRKAPTRLSLAGSFIAIDKTTAPFLEAIARKEFEDLGGKEYQSAMVKLGHIRKKLDPRTVPYFTSVSDFLIVVRRYGDKEFGNRNQLSAAIAEIEASQERIEKEAAKLRDNREIQEELDQ